MGRILVVGAGGYMGRTYLRLLSALGIPDRQIVAVDKSTARPDDGAQWYNGPDSLNEALSENDDLGVAIVLVNTPQHFPVVAACQRHGLSRVFVEKPLVYSAAELQPSVFEKLKQLYVGYLINFSPVVPALISFAREHELEIIHCTSVWGKRWLAEDRPMGDDLEEEMTHPFMLGYTHQGLEFPADIVWIVLQVVLLQFYACSLCLRE